MSFTEAQLVENYAAALDEITRLKPSAAKGRYIRKTTIATTMGPGIPVDPQRTRDLLAEDERRRAGPRPRRDGPARCFEAPPRAVAASARIAASARLVYSEAPKTVGRPTRAAREGLKVPQSGRPSAGESRGSARTAEHRLLSAHAPRLRRGVRHVGPAPASDRSKENMARA